MSVEKRTSPKIGKKNHEPNIHKTTKTGIIKNKQNKNKADFISKSYHNSI